MLVHKTLEGFGSLMLYALCWAGQILKLFSGCCRFSIKSY